MERKRGFGVLFTLALAAAACSGSSSPDAGVDSTADVQSNDTMVSDDAQTEDAADDAPAMDVQEADAQEADTGAADTGAADTGAADTGAPDAAMRVVHGCTSYEDRSLDGDPRLVTIINSDRGPRYSPQCMRIRVGQTATIRASVTHPLQGGRAPRESGDPGDTPNPIPSTTAPAMVRFPNAGIFPYYCTAHDRQGQIGAIEVVP